MLAFLSYNPPTHHISPVKWKTTQTRVYSLFRPLRVVSTYNFSQPDCRQTHLLWVLGQQCQSHLCHSPFAQLINNKTGASGTRDSDIWWGCFVSFVKVLPDSDCRLQVSIYTHTSQPLQLRELFSRFWWLLLPDYTVVGYERDSWSGVEIPYWDQSVSYIDTYIHWW